MNLHGPDEAVYLPKGFFWSATKAGIKASGRSDVALAEAPLGASAAAMFTRNRVAAAPVEVGRKHLRRSKGRVRAVLVNAGNANCATGAQGVAVAEQSCAALGKALEAAPEFIIPSSTGIIGVPLPVEKLMAAVPAVVEALADDEAALKTFATAIMTTDTVMKLASTEFFAGKKTVRIAGVCKGSGMIHPNMATMLVYIFTDLDAEPAQLQAALKAAVDPTFNAISVDGDTSTNDTVLLLASGASTVKLGASGVAKKFAEALRAVCASLAAQVVRDGEGAQHLVRLQIAGAKSMEEARTIARSIANSPLVKTAWAGCDPNWGRILSSVGKSGVAVDPARVNIFIGPQQVCKHGMAHPFDEKAAHEYLKQREYGIRVELGRGKHALEFLTCDLTVEYVHINADYST
jgi:glutamate N-acetyltransferase / amino-acid N-acetyltransferase